MSWFHMKLGRCLMGKLIILDVDDFQEGKRCKYKRLCSKASIESLQKVLDEHHEYLSSLDGSASENALTSSYYAPVNRWLESYIDKRKRRDK